MDLLERLSNNKGTVSSALGKELAREILDGNVGLLKQAIPFVCHNAKIEKDKHIRSGAAKIVECVAEAKPELVAPYLEKLLAALEVGEPQTRWMVIRTMGFCAPEKPEIAQKAIPAAKKYIYEKRDGQLCLAGSADMFLGDYGAISRERAEEAFPILIQSTNNVILNEHDWIMESFIKIATYLNAKSRRMILDFANEYAGHPRKATQERIRKLTELCSK